MGAQVHSAVSDSQLGPTILARQRSGGGGGAASDQAPAAHDAEQMAEMARRDSLPSLPLTSGSTVRFAPMHDGSASPTGGVGGGIGGGGGGDNCGDSTPSLQSAWGCGSQSHSRGVSESASFLHSLTATPDVVDGSGGNCAGGGGAHAHAREMSTLAEENAADLQAASAFVSACPTPLSGGARTPATQRS